jgi:hypothetical protein
MIARVYTTTILHVNTRYIRNGACWFVFLIRLISEKSFFSSVHVFYPQYIYIDMHTVKFSMEYYRRGTEPGSGKYSWQAKG